MRFYFKVLNFKILAIFVVIICLFCAGINNIQNNNLTENSILTKERDNISNNFNSISNHTFISNDLKNNNFTNINFINELTSNILEQEEWNLNIPKINLSAKIADGTSSEILNQYIGHFSETPKQNGNVVLAGHNRGYNVNYFQRLKELEIGDSIYYTYNGTTKHYIVNSKKIIKDTEVNILENTEDNILTLITCVEDEPEYRRCIQAIENKKGERVKEVN